MKCDELERHTLDVWEDMSMYEPLVKASDVDAAIDELKTEHHKERDEYIIMVHSREQTIKELKAKLESVQASMYCDVVDANMENRRLKEERRWRKFSDEKPEHHQWILVFYPNHSQFTAGVELRRWDDGCKYDVEVQEIYEKWMPLPEPPKEDYK